jgi:hypothetical protein
VACSDETAAATAADPYMIASAPEADRRSAIRPIIRATPAHARDAQRRVLLDEPL